MRMNMNKMEILKEERVVMGGTLQTSSITDPGPVEVILWPIPSPSAADLDIFEKSLQYRRHKGSTSRFKTLPRRLLIQVIVNQFGRM